MCGPPQHDNARAALGTLQLPTLIQSKEEQHIKNESNF